MVRPKRWGLELLDEGEGGGFDERVKAETETTETLSSSASDETEALTPDSSESAVAGRTSNGLHGTLSAA